MFKKIALTLSFCYAVAFAQPVNYSVANAHSHNDYINPDPFWAAYHTGFGSIEADIFLVGDKLIVAHDQQGVLQNRSLQDLYLKPLADCIGKNGGHVYADTSRKLQMLIDIKTEAIPTLAKLVSVLRGFPELINNPSVQWVISGGRPQADDFNKYPSFIYFDGELNKNYNEAALQKIALFSEDLHHYTKWKGSKSSIPDQELQSLKTAISKAHELHKPVRFWDAPDSLNAWYQLMDLGVDYINTDRIQDMGLFLKKLSSTTFTSTATHAAYLPTYKSDGVDRPVKNVILLIGDGTGLAQLYAGYTANRAALSIFAMVNIGLSKTSSYDNFVTDSAPGATSIASGEKTKNRYVGVDHTGRAMPLLPMLLAPKKVKTGIITCGDITDATPADFYAHRSDRDSSAAIFGDLAESPIQLIMGSGNKSFDAGIKKNLEAHQFHIATSIDSVGNMEQNKWVVIDEKAGRSVLNGRGPWLGNALDRTIQALSKNKEGFFIMTEGAQIDHGGHANNLPYVATEVIDFDEAIGKALQFADTNGETLVIVTADHETGGLSLLDGNYKSGTISGQFATGHHTAIPVPVFAYGPRSTLFRGVYENTALFEKILQAYGIK